MGSPRWSRLLAGPVDLWREEPMLEQVFWQELWPVGDSHQSSPFLKDW